jgi:CheY-like chemotaxis protein
MARVDQPEILLIEDSPGGRWILRYCLERQGEPFELVTIGDGREALKYLTEAGPGNQPPGVIVVDRFLPKHDGIEIIHAIQRNPALTATRIVYFSEFADTTFMAEGALPGILAREKPKTIDEFDDFSKQLLDLARPAV